MAYSLLLIVVLVLIVRISFSYRSLSDSALMRSLILTNLRSNFAFSPISRAEKASLFSNMFKWLVVSTRVILFCFKSCRACLAVVYSILSLDRFLLSSFAIPFSSLEISMSRKASCSWMIVLAYGMLGCFFFSLKSKRSLFNSSFSVSILGSLERIWASWDLVET